MTQQRQAQGRSIRVFVSSTFRDMQAERDELVLRIFPQIRRLCEERGVTWGEVDLRWGISDEQKAEGKVLPICLEEIRRCRPYFIGLLGERYGWIPDSIPDEVVEREPWIGEYAAGDDKKSVTELEILHGVLNNPAMADHAFFYFRDPRYVDRIPEEQRGIYIEANLINRERLAALKERIRDSDVAWNDNYSDPATLGQWVLADFTALIDRLYPEGEQPSPLERERMDHEAFARSRAGVYIGRQEYFDRLDDHVAVDGPPLVVLGDSGGGKSALLANWFLDRFGPLALDSQPSTFALLHFIGSSPGSANAIGILRRIMLELRQEFDLPDDVPAQHDKIHEAFPNWLAQTAARGRVVLVLDALNQLEDVDNAPDLGWLPRVFPKNCRVIVSALPGRSLNAVEQRGWLANQPLTVHPLHDAERRRLIGEFLAQYTRDLGPDRTDQLARVPQTANPLFLRVLLDELRVFGLHEKLNERIGWYLEARDPCELYRKVIIRWEEAYADGTDLVRDVLSLLWAARRGLSESELLEAVGQSGRPLPNAVWSPLYLAMSDALVSRSGLLTFAHAYLRMAARDAFLPGDSDQQNAHRRLAGYFQQKSTWNDRRLEELPWQLAEAGEWQHLHESLTEQACFLGLRQRNEFELLGYWLRLKPEFDPAKSYTAAFTRWEHEEPDDSRLSFLANELGVFLFEKAACHAAAEPLMRRALTIDEQSHGAEHPDVARDLNNLALLLQDTNRLTEAETLMRRALVIDEQSYGPEDPGVAVVLNNLAGLLCGTNRSNEAIRLYERVVGICEVTYGENHPDVATALSNLAWSLKETNRLAEAEPLMRRALAIKEQSYGSDHPDVATALNNLALLLKATNRLAEAEPLMRRTLAIDEQTYGADHPKVGIRLHNLSHLLRVTNRLAEAEPLMLRTLEILLTFTTATGQSHPHLQAAINNYAGLLHAMHLSESQFRQRLHGILAEHGMSDHAPIVTPVPPHEDTDYENAYFDDLRHAINAHDVVEVERLIDRGASPVSTEGSVESALSSLCAKCGRQLEENSMASIAAEATKDRSEVAVMKCRLCGALLCWPDCCLLEPCPSCNSTMGFDRTKAYTT